MRAMTAERAANEIRRAYGTFNTQHGQGAWMSIRSIAERTDLTAQEIAEGCRHLISTDPSFNLIPESNQKMLTAIDHELAVWSGNQRKHLISWD
ncbi:hypothetical protein [Micromonospora sp. NPDC004704]